MKQKSRKRKQFGCFALSLIMSAGIFQGMPVKVRAADYEAKIGSAYYEQLEEAFENAQPGDTITVLKDCSVSKTLEVTADNITLKSADSGSPAVIRRDAEFAGKYYAEFVTNALIGAEGDKFSTEDIIFDGGAVFDADFNNTGRNANGPLIYVKGAYDMKEGTVLQNNQHVRDSDPGYVGVLSSGGIHVASKGSLFMTGGVIRNCYSSGSGGGIHSDTDSHVAAVSGVIRNCCAMSGAGAYFSGDAELSNMTFMGNTAKVSGGAVSAGSGLVVKDCILDGNRAGSSGGAVNITTERPAEIMGCRITGNVSSMGSAISYNMQKMAQQPLLIRDCTITGNRGEGAGSCCAVWYGNGAGMIMDGSIVMENNLETGHYPCDIMFSDGNLPPIRLGENFISASSFVLGAYQEETGMALVDGKEADTEQFTWNEPDYVTEKRDGTLYLAEAPETYSINYFAVDNNKESLFVYTDPAEYTAEDTVTLIDKETFFSKAVNFSNPGYEFDAWNTEADGSGMDYAEGQEIHLTADMDLYVKWKAAVPSVLVTFDADGAEMEGGSITAQKGDIILLPSCKKDGYDFIGWYDNGVCVGKAGEEYTVTGDVSLKACFEKKTETGCTVSFDTNGGKEIAPMKAEKGTSIRLPEAEKENCIFRGWYGEKECSSLNGTAGDEVQIMEDTVFYAGWERNGGATEEKPDEKPEATVTFDADGAEMEGGSITAREGDTITLPSCRKDGYEFAGWYDGDTCVGQAGDEYTVAGDVSLKARFEKKAETVYAITFDTDGGEKIAPVKAERGTVIRLPEARKSGYRFLGWYTEKGGGIFLGNAGDSMTVTENRTVYASWEKEKEEGNTDGKPEMCRAVFHTEGGALENNVISVVKNARLSLPLPEREGYDFTGWYLDRSLTQFAGTYRDVYRVTEDTDFYAGWEKAEINGTDQNTPAETITAFTIKYDANGGSTKHASVKVMKGRSIKLPDAERTGYSFEGWYTDKKVFAGTAGASYRPAGNITLYAGWEAEGGRSGISGTDRDASAGTPALETDTAVEKGGTGYISSNAFSAEKQKEPVAQTGYTSPACIFAVLGLSGILFLVLSVYKRKDRKA